MAKPRMGYQAYLSQMRGSGSYDLGKEDPVTCIECGRGTWTPEPVLKSKQPIPFEGRKERRMVEADRRSGRR